MEQIRTFIAVDVAEEVRQQAGQLIETLRRVDDTVKWVDPQNMHLTLKFLGDVPQGEVTAVCQAVAEAVADQGPFAMLLKGAGAFPSIARPRTVWLGVVQGREELCSLQVAIDRALKKLGYPKETRRFEPHLTIGRIRRGGPALAELSQRLREQQAYEAGETSVGEVVVYASYLDRTGPTYQAMSRAALTAGKENLR